MSLVRAQHLEPNKRYNMKSSEFCYWLQGMFELANPTELSSYQTELIRKHLSLVFAHELDAQHGDEAHQAVLNAIHSADPSPPENVHEVLFRC